MKFYKLSKSIHGECRQNIIDKAEYFWHFWDFLFTENRNLVLVDEPKFTSQVSLIDKIIKHLEWNKGFSSNKLVKYFSQHIYFNKGNLILRGNPELLLQVQEIKSFVENSKNDSEESNYLKTQDREQLLNAFSGLKSRYLELNQYSNLLIDKLIRIIFNDKELNKTNKKDLKFLCNSIIDVFVLKGYSLAFIKGLLNNTIFHSSNKFRFKYPKNYGDFDSDEDWREYVSEQFKLISFKDRLNYLKEFLFQSPKKGFYIFKIEGVAFDSEPMKIFESTFYNPLKDKFLKFYETKNSMIREENNAYYTQCELFNMRYLNDVLEENNSSCNLIVPIEYYPQDIDYFDSFKFPSKSFIEARNRAQVSLLEFKRLIQGYSIEYFFDEGLTNVRVSHESILVDEDFHYHKISNNRSSNKIAFKLDDIRKNMLGEQLNYKGKIKLQNSFSIHLANSNALIASYKQEYHKFNFKSFWIECIEPYFDDTNDFIEYAKKSIRIRANFFTEYRILLSYALKNDLFSYQTYCLNKEKMEKTGIGELNVGEHIIGDYLEKGFELLPSGSLLCEFKDEMRLFVKDELSFMIKMDSWIYDTIKIAYDERNIEVHYNLVDYYNDVSIKKDILFICSCMIGAFNDAVFKHNVSSVKEAKKYINNTFDGLEK